MNLDVQHYGVKQLIGRHWVNEYKSFNVFHVGDPKYFLFCLLDSDGCDCGIHIPVKKMDLKKEVRVNLNKGLVRSK